MASVKLEIRALSTPGLPSARYGRLLPLLGIWLGAVLIAGFFAKLMGDAAVVDGHYVPMTNDSFYHARRVLDALGSRGFYQFDERLHAPMGTWIPWPWAYDYLLAKTAALITWLRPGLNPLGIIFHVPFAWLLVNAALFLTAASALKLSIEMRLLAMVCFALSPFTQLLHVIGMVDHHYVEYSFILLSIWLGLRWFAAPADWRWPAALGATLGLAPGFHTALFILQIPPLACVFVLWLRGQAPPRRSMLAFSGALLASMQIVLWPADTFRAGLFDFGLLSTFHLYVAVCTSVCLLYMGSWTFSKRTLSLLTLLGLVLTAPIAAQAVRGLEFIAGRFSILPDIVEAQSVFKLMTAESGPMDAVSYYSWLVVAAPVLIALHAWKILTKQPAERLFFSIWVVFGLVLLLEQFRFYYYGFFGLVTALLLLVDDARRRYAWHRGGAFVAAALVVLLAYQPALRHRLFEIYAPAADRDYALAMPIYETLSRLCATDPAIVLAGSDDGNPILFHTNCRVISNNFILSSADVESLDRVGRFMRMAPEEIRSEAPEVRYLIVRANDFGFVHNGQFGLVADSPMVQQLFLPRQPPAGFTLISKINSGADEVRLYRIDAETLGTG